jgi:predicted phosphodiesterase
MRKQSRILVVGDTHIPVIRAGYLEFCQDLYQAWDCNTVIHIGDVVDFHSISFHEKHPDCPSPKYEYEEALAGVQKLYRAFPTMAVCIGNHDERVHRLAASVGIPDLFIKTYNDIWRTPKWTWAYNHVIDNIYFTHGHGGCGGVYPASNMLRSMLMSVVIGHHHSASGVKWYTNPNQRIFAVDTGAGIDDKSKQFAYSQHNPKRSVISAAVIIDGIPYVEPMPCSKGEKYWDGNFK